MRKILWLLIMLLLPLENIGGQDMIRTDFPTIVPPSPSVAAIMKYEEVPVNNYTGVPDISLPLINLNTGYDHVSLNVNLAYHISNVKADNVAGDVGLGWSLVAGGTISRTVRGLPDEELTVGFNPSMPSTGLYNNNIQYNANPYYSFSQNPVQFELNNPELANEYYWETVENNRNDTEHDLWQFNFLGHTGSFYVKKNDDSFIIEPLSDYRIKIYPHFEPGINQPIQPAGFTVFDEKGYKYSFNIYEITTKSTDTKTITNIQSELITSESHKDEKPFRSAFHLSKISDPNNNTVLEITYSPQEFVENSRQYNQIENDYGSDSNDLYNAMRRGNCWSEIPPVKTEVLSNIITKVKKIQTINLPGRAIVDFNYLSGRLDSNTSSVAPYLKEVTLKNIANKTIFNYIFEYDYNAIISNRMFLLKLKKSYPGQPQSENQEFFYKRTIPFSTTTVYGKDSWGYFNTYNSDNCTSQNINFMRETSPMVSTLDLLQKIKLPTGGSAIFVFETNQYSFKGDQGISDFHENPLNNVPLSTETYYFSNNDLQYISAHPQKRKIVVYPSIVLDGDFSSNTRNFSLLKIINGQIVPVGSIYCIEPNANCCLEFVLEEGVQYAFRRNNFDVNYSGTDMLTVSFSTNNQNNKFLFGGGNRISRIAYFDTDVAANFYDLPNPPSPSKEKVYNYTLPADQAKSSGSLVFGKPIFEDMRAVKMLSTGCMLPPYSDLGTYFGLFMYPSKFILSSQETILTHGSSVGYKNVTVSELGAGSSEYIYTSPLDYPELELITYTKPFLPSKNIDYKRGLLLKHIIKDSGSKITKQITNTYTFEQHEKIYGYRFNKPDGISFQGRLKHFQTSGMNAHTYDNFKQYVLQPGNSVKDCAIPPGFAAPLCDFFHKSHLGIPKNDIDYYPLVSAYGWAKLSSQVSNEYFYDGLNQNIIVDSTIFEYNSANKELSQKSVITSDGTVFMTKYFYDLGNNSPYSENRISDINRIEIYKNNSLISHKEIDYANTWTANAAFLPQKIKEYSLQANTSALGILTYDSYDPKGNLVQYTSNTGVHTTIIWGYNQTQPIAKIEGIDLNALPSYLIPPVVTASDADNLQGTSSSEQSLVEALDVFRKAVYALNRINVQITTYTYDPLIGVRSITPPSGIRESYIYDSANRLEKVVDVNGNILKEFKYNYKQ